MKILLLCPSVGFYASPRGLAHPLGPISIGTYLEKKGHQVRLCDRSVEKTKIDDILDDFAPEIVGVSIISSRGINDAMKISKHIKEKLNIPVVWGGPLPSMHINLVLEKDFVDIVSYGEGEETWEELVDCFENNKPIDNVQGIAYRKDGKIVETPCRPFADLGKFPAADWSLIPDVTKYMAQYLGCKKMMYINSSKGCPYRCAFCQNVSFHKSTHRKRPNDIVIEEIKYLADNYGLDGVYMMDEMWVIKREDMLDFCQKVHENNLNFHWGIEFRVGFFKEEDFQTMYDAGCRWIFFGIESGNPEMSKRIHKSIDLNEVKPTMDMLRKIGITSICSYIVGFPDETAEQIRDTVKLIRESNADFSLVNHFSPLPGTELYDEAVSKNRYEGIKSLEDLAKEVSLDSVGTNLSAVPTIDLRVLRSWYNWKGFTNKTSFSAKKSFGYARETITNMMRIIFLKGPASLLFNGFSAFREFLYNFWYSHAYPDIIKKYDLKK